MTQGCAENCSALHKKIKSVSLCSRSSASRTLLRQFQSSTASLAAIAIATPSTTIRISLQNAGQPIDGEKRCQRDRRAGVYPFFRPLSAT
jgi:hypothetical protein